MLIYTVCNEKYFDINEILRNRINLSGLYTTTFKMRLYGWKYKHVTYIRNCLISSKVKPNLNVETYIRYMRAAVR
jgi:hypothetical protein